MNLKFLTLILVACIMMAGCLSGMPQSKAENATQTLLTAKEVIVGVAQTADQMCSQGLLTQSQCDEVAKVYADTQAAYTVAASSLQAALKSDQDVGAWNSYAAFHQNFSIFYSGLLSLAGKFGILEADQ